MSSLVVERLLYHWDVQKILSLAYNFLGKTNVTVCIVIYNCTKYDPHGALPVSWDDRSNTIKN